MVFLGVGDGDIDIDQKQLFINHYAKSILQITHTCILDPLKNFNNLLFILHFLKKANGVIVMTLFWR
jgi:hypothetical protein